MPPQNSGGSERYRLSLGGDLQLGLLGGELLEWGASAILKIGSAVLGFVSATLEIGTAVTRLPPYPWEQSRHTPRDLSLMPPGP